MTEAGVALLEARWIQEEQEEEAREAAARVAAELRAQDRYLVCSCLSIPGLAHRSQLLCTTEFHYV